jgi:hypothetical protein
MSHDLTTLEPMPFKNMHGWDEKTLAIAIGMASPAISLSSKH